MLCATSATKASAFLVRISRIGFAAMISGQVIDDADLRLGTAYDHTDTDRTGFFPDRCHKGIASAFDLPVTASRRQEQTVTFAVGDFFLLVGQGAFSIQDQYA